MRAGRYAQWLLRLVPAVQTEITDMDQLRHQFRIDRSVGTRVRTRAARDTAHVVADEQFLLVRLLFQGLTRAGIHTMRLFTPPANQDITGQLCARNDPVIPWMIEITAFCLAVFALASSAHVKIDKQPQAVVFLWLVPQLRLMKLFCAVEHGARGTFLSTLLHAIMKEVPIIKARERSGKPFVSY